LLLEITFGVGGAFNIDQFFAQDRQGDGGNTKGEIIPAPGAVVLGMMGLALVGRMRRA
jgi:hypothetical protein